MRTLLITAAWMVGGGGVASVAALAGYCLSKRAPWWLGWAFIAGNVVVALGISLALAAYAWWIIQEFGLYGFCLTVGVTAFFLGLAASVSALRGDGKP